MVVMTGPLIGPRGSVKIHAPSRKPLSVASVRSAGRSGMAVRRSALIEAVGSGRNGAQASSPTGLVARVKRRDLPRFRARR